VLLGCEEMNLVGGTMFALDGCKLPSDASKEWSGTIVDLRTKKEKIETTEGCRIYPQRLAIVEPVFANIRSNQR
jgi:hypothetical protein